MRRVPLLFVLVVLLGAGACFADDTLWTRTFDLGGKTQILSVKCQGTDVYLGGQVEPDAFININMFAARHSGNGDEIWTAQLDLDTIQIGGMIAVGPDQSPYLALVAGIELATVIAKFNTSGETLWTRKPGNVLPRAIAADASSNCYMFGTTGPNPMPTDSLWLGRYDADGNQTLNAAVSIATAHSPGQLCITGDGNLAATGSVLDTGSVWHSVLVKFSTSGETIWTKRPEPPIVGFGPIAAGDSNTIYMVAYTSTDVGLLKLGSDGTPVWGVTLPLVGQAEALAADPAGNCYLTYTGAEKDFYLDKYGPDGQFIGTGRAGTPDNDFPMDLAADSAGNVIVVGYSQDSLGTRMDGYVVKFKGTSGWVLEPEELRPAGPWRLVGTVTDGTRLDWQINRPAECRFSIFDAAGRQVYGYAMAATTGRHSLSLPGLASGVYLVRLETDGSACTQKLLVQK